MRVVAQPVLFTLSPEGVTLSRGAVGRFARKVKRGWLELVSSWNERREEHPKTRPQTTRTGHPPIVMRVFGRESGPL